MIRRRYLVKTYRPDDYAPYDVRKFRHFADVAEFIKAERRARLWLPEFNVTDRKSIRSKWVYPKATKPKPPIV